MVGKGFTECTNVTRARPVVPDLYQPHLPADLGFFAIYIFLRRVWQKPSRFVNTL